MSFATVERLLAGADDARIYSREPALAIVQQLTQPGSSVASRLGEFEVDIQRQLGWRGARGSRSGFTTRHIVHLKYGSANAPDLPHGASSDMTGLAPQQIINALVKRPTSFKTKTTNDRPTEEENAVASKSVSAGTLAPAIQPHSFLGSTGGRVRFADIETSSDDDLLEAGYPYFANAEDSDLARESIRSVIDRIAAKQS